MLGFRGCRIAIAYPEIAEMQARAIFEAAVEAGKRTGKAVGLEVMVPLIATKAEFDLIKARIDATALSVMKETGTKLGYQVGTMIELPRACLMAGDDRADRGVLLLRHQRPDADHLWHQPRRRRELPRHLYRQGNSGDRSVHLGRSRRRRRTRQDRRRARPQDPARTSRSASAANMAAIPLRWRSATRSASTTSRARPIACRSRVSPPRKPRSARPWRARRRPRCPHGGSAMRRHARACPGHPRLCRSDSKTWMPGVGSGSDASFGRLCPAMTRVISASRIDTIATNSSSFLLTGYLPLCPSGSLPTLFDVICAKRSDYLPVSRAATPINSLGNLNSIPTN